MRKTKEQKKAKICLNPTAHFPLPTSKKGITLIALIITIIVMLILVAVTITTAINGGLFEKAGQAVGDTKNSINAEQKLADGKIKIGDFWYASIDDYLNNNPITTGITVDKATLTLKKKESEEAEGEEILEGTITASVFGMDQEPEITWEVTPADKTAVTLSGTTGKTITVTAVGTAKETVTVTAKCTYEGTLYSVPCEVSLKIIKLANIKIGDFVEYGIEYKDVYYENYTYSTTNGWRLLNYKTDDEGETIYDVELISTGVPAQLYYYNTSYSATGNNKWWVTDIAKIAEFKTVLENYYTTDDTSQYSFDSNTANNTYASAGMYYNLKEIPFYAESDYNAIETTSDKYNIGWYRSITKGTETLTGNKVGSDIFIASPGNSVRMLTLPEINSYAGKGISECGYILSSTQEPAAGLYILQNIKNTELSGNSYSNGCYRLASPFVGNSYGMNDVSYHGYVGSSNSKTYGVRPVVSLGSGVHYTVEIEKDSTTGMDYYTLTAE